MYKCYLTCPRGLEKLANDEISTYSENITIGNGGINFHSSINLVYILST